MALELDQRIEQREFINLFMETARQEFIENLQWVPPEWDNKKLSQWMIQRFNDLESK